MNRNIKAMAALKKTSETWNLALILLITVIILCVGIFGGFDKEELGVAYASALAGAFFSINLFIKVFVLVEEIPRGLSFGMTRRKLFINSRVVDLLEVIVIAFICFAALGFHGPMVTLKCAAIAYGFFMWIEGVACNEVVRYGKVAYWIYYIVMLILMIGLPKVLHRFIGSSASLFGVIYDGIAKGAYNQGLVWFGILLFIASGLAVNWLTFRKMPVILNS